MSHMEVHPDLFQTHPAENSFLKMGKEVGRATESSVHWRKEEFEVEWLLSG